MKAIRRFMFTIRNYRRAHDGSTPQNPRKDGTYGWPS